MSTVTLRHIVLNLSQREQSFQTSDKDKDSRISDTISGKQKLEMYITADFTSDLQADIRGIFSANGHKEPVAEEGLVLFILLKLVHAQKKAVRCMGVKQSGRKDGIARREKEIKSSELCSNMIELFYTVRNPTLYGENLARKIYQVSFHFLCSQHRKNEFAEQLTLGWFPLVAQHRDWYPLPTFIPGQDPRTLHPTLLPQAQIAQAPTVDLKPILLPNGEAAYLSPEQRAWLVGVMVAEHHGFHG